MPYRDAGIDEFCAVCAAATGRSCRRCQRPCCDAHVSRGGDCTPCDVARRERSSLRVAWSAFVAVGAAACALLVVALVGSGVAVAIAMGGVATAVVVAWIDDRRRALVAGEQELPRATLRRP
jgi:hypothetical protein